MTIKFIQICVELESKDFLNKWSDRITESACKDYQAFQWPVAFSCSSDNLGVRFSIDLENTKKWMNE